MSDLKRVAVSIGDLNGIGIQLALENHEQIKTMVSPLYCIDSTMLSQASQKLDIPIPIDFMTVDDIAPHFQIRAGEIDKLSGSYSYQSFQKATDLAKKQEVDAICTLPINKKAWEEAGIQYKGHTDALRDFFHADAIMMLGCDPMYVALFTEHIPLKEVAQSINEADLIRFLVDFYNSAKPSTTVAVLALNPHAGDGGVLGDEEIIIQKAVDSAHKLLGLEIFTYPLVPDIAFIPQNRDKYRYYIAMYHDQGLTPLKTLYFDEGINISLNLPIIRTSVDHGTAFDIAYLGKKLNNKSYINSIEYIAKS